jgi:hypothetical protein
MQCQLQLLHQKQGRQSLVHRIEYCAHKRGGMFTLICTHTRGNQSIVSTCTCTCWLTCAYAHLQDHNYACLCTWAWLHMHHESEHTPGTSPNTNSDTCIHCLTAQDHQGWLNHCRPGAHAQQATCCWTHTQTHTRIALHKRMHWS